MKKIILFLFFCFLAIQASAELKVGLVLEKAGKDDKSFNASAYEGAMKAKKDLNVFVKVVEAQDDNSFEPLQRAFAEKKFDLVISIGFSQGSSLKKTSAKFPDIKFAIVDTEVSGPNVRSLMFEEHEGSYLAGALAALHAGPSETIGFVGGMDIPLIRRFQLGYEAGAKKIKPNIKIITNYIGVTSDAWSNPGKGKALALDQFNRGADVVYAGAGTSNMGVFDAAEETKKLAIGCDSNQNWIKPGFILSSMMKRVDEAVYSSIKDLKEGKWSAGTIRYGLKNQGIELAMDSHNKKLMTAKDEQTLKTLKNDILNGKIKVPDYYLQKK